MITLNMIAVDLFEAFLCFCVFFGFQVKSYFVRNPLLIGYWTNFIISFVYKLAELFETLHYFICVCFLHLLFRLFHLFLQIWKLKIYLFEFLCVILELPERKILFNQWLFFWLWYNLDQVTKFEEKVSAPFVMAQIHVRDMTEESCSGEFINFMVELILHWVQIQDQLKFCNAVWHLNDYSVVFCAFWKFVFGFNDSAIGKFIDLIFDIIESIFDVKYWTKGTFRSD